MSLAAFFQNDPVFPCCAGVVQEGFEEIWMWYELLQFNEELSLFQDSSRVWRRQESPQFILLNACAFLSLSPPTQILGDIMGPALQNLGQLLEMPFGCGEQNMVQFAPNIFILEYLQKTKQLDPEIENIALHFLITGKHCPSFSCKKKVP